MKGYFEERLSEANDRYDFLERQSRRMALLRLIWVAGSLILLVWFANQSSFYPLVSTLFIFFTVFILLVKRHNRIRYKKNHEGFLMEINKEELKRLQKDFSGLDEGNEFKSDEHPFSADLDLFGKHSVFQMLNRCNSSVGRTRLASLLKEDNPGREEIVGRQEMVIELASMVDWRQNLQALGRHDTLTDGEEGIITDWLSGERERENNVMSGWWIILAFLPSSALLAAWLTGLPWWLVLVSMAINGFALRRIIPPMADIQVKTDQAAKLFRKSSALFREIESKELSSARWKEIRQELAKGNNSASKSIGELGKIMEWFAARGNMLYGMLDAFFLADFFLLRSYLSWIKGNNLFVEGWFRALGWTEAFCSLAGHAYANPSHTFPKISSEPFIFRASALGHPLISEHERVDNDLKLQGTGLILLITGSNMSGKSTFLRTMGLNMVLAWSGGPVCAKKLEVSVFRLFTSMRTHDNLEEHVSSFFAELKRIRKLVAMVDEPGTPVFFLLDEILKGTNSSDRHRGGRALIRQMIEKNAMGCISTHDLELSTLSGETESLINMSFNSHLQSEKLIFDYTISEGVCKSFNAAILMQQMGIQIEDN